MHKLFLQDSIVVLATMYAFFPEPSTPLVEVPVSPNGELATLISQLHTLMAQTPSPQTPAADVAATIAALQSTIAAAGVQGETGAPGGSQQARPPTVDVNTTIAALRLTTEATSIQVPGSVPTRPLATATTMPFVPPSGHIVYTCHDGQVDNICRIDADGRNQVQLTFDTQTSYYADLSFDGQQVIWSSRRDGSFQIYLMDINGGSQRLVSPSASLGSYFAPNLSPDGSRIIFTLARNNAQNVWVMNSDGSGLAALTDTADNNLDATWSPDGTQIAFVSDRNGAIDLFVMDADGSRVRALNVGVANMGGRNDWSPDGNWLIFYAGERQKHQIYLVSVVTGEVRQITNRYDNLAPAFSPDGQWITFASWRDGDGEIYIMRPDGGDVRQLTFNEQSDWQPRWGP